jgi:hypothetical protein
MMRQNFLQIAVKELNKSCPTDAEYDFWVEKPGKKPK